MNAFTIWLKEPLSGPYEGEVNEGLHPEGHSSVTTTESICVIFWEYDIANDRTKSDYPNVDRLLQMRTIMATTRGNWTNGLIEACALTEVVNIPPPPLDVNTP